MLYLLMSIAYYKQLRAVDQELVEAAEGDIAALERLYGYRKEYVREGLVLYLLGQEHGLDLRRVMEFVYRLHAALASRTEQLYGFSLLLSRRTEAVREALIGSVSKVLLQVEEDGEIWIEPECLPLLDDLVQTKRLGPLLKIVSRETSAKPDRMRKQRLWKETRLARQVARTLKSQYRARGRNRGLLIHGPVASERKLLLDGIEALLFSDYAVPRTPRLHTLFKRRSPFHPFLNSIDPFFLEAAPRYLAEWERQVWIDLVRILWSLKPSARSARGSFFRWPKGVPGSLSRSKISAEAEQRLRQEVRGQICPDQLFQDFHLVYQLYLSAYFRMMEENFLPAVLICEDVDTYHPRSLELLASLLDDFYQLPSFIPVFTSRSRELPQALAGRHVDSVTMSPLSSKEMSRLAARLYRGCEIPPEALATLRRYGRGKLLTFYHCLLFLEAQGFLCREGRKVVWKEKEALQKILPARNLSLSWSLISSLSFALKRLLFLVHLQSGLLDLWGFIALLQKQGMAQEDAFALLRDLERLGLVHIGGHVVPLFPGFRKRLRRAVLGEEEDLERSFVDHLLDTWRSGEFPHLVLLYFLLTKTRRIREAWEVLAALLKQKLDELDFRGVSVFLDPKHMHLGSSLDAAEQKNMQRLLTAARLRLALLRGRLKEAEGIYLKAVEMGDDFQTSPAKGGLFLQMCRYLLARGESKMGMQWAKKSVIQFQSARDAAGEREATLGLGAVFLAEGRFDEALEYFAISEKISPETIGLEDIRTHGLRAVTLFIQGNLSRAEGEAERGLELSRSAQRHEWELFLQFLNARIAFELGFYEEAVCGFQTGLALQALYENPAARKVLYAWLGRSYAYSGSLFTAGRVLKDTEESWEKHFFLSEISFFAGDYSAALQDCDRAISLQQESGGDWFPAERIEWLDGFWDIEGRCFELLREKALVRRLTHSFQAYLWGLRGSSERGIEQLYSITRGSQLPEADPYLSLYSYYYARVLPEVRQGELDDSLTVLNKALKLLQQRASKIEDSTRRWRYLNNNYWNSLLFAEARNKKMI